MNFVLAKFPKEYRSSRLRHGKGWWQIRLWKDRWLWWSNHP